MKEKQTIYFLDWIQKNYDIDIELWLENCRKENKGWLNLEGPELPKNLIDFTDCFQWENALDNNPNYGCIDDEWFRIIESKKYDIEYSRFPIKDFKMVIPTEDFKLNFK